MHKETEMNRKCYTFRIGFAALVAIAAVAGVVLLLGRTNAAQAAPSATIQSMINNAPDGGTVSVPAGTYTESLTVNKTLTLTGVSSATTIIRAVTGQRVVTVTSGHTLRLENLTLTGGQIVGNDGGGVYVSDGSLQIVNCVISDNRARYGGGVYQWNAGRVDVIGSRIERNQATQDGGGLYVYGDAALTNTWVLTNTANRHGGGLHVGAGRADVLGGLFAGNQATSGNGGGINLNNSISLSGTQFISNTAGQDGGGLLQWNAGQQVNVTNVRFERNQAARNGGGLCVSQGATATLTSSVFVSNTTDAATTETRGGGAYVSGSTQVLSSTFRGNEATCSSCGYTYGGGLYNASTLSITVQGGLFESNYAWLGGGLHDANGSASIRGVTFSTNSAGYGGGVYASHVTVENSCFMHNDAERRGGGLEAWNGATLASTRFISNTAEEGGGLSLYGSNTTMVNTVVVDNQASLRGSGVYITASPVQAFHTTIARNTGGDGSGVYADAASTVAMTNTILVSQAVGITVTSDVIVTLNGVLWYGNTANTGGPATINVTNDLAGTPAFAADGYHLTAASMAVDHGVNSGVTSDIDGDPRPSGAGYDIGADELLSVYLPLVLRNY
jgi:predicted outer membrane repeat protein